MVRVLIYVLSALFMASPVSAFASGASNISLTEKERLQASKIRALLSKYVYSLDRELMTFHYQSAESPDSYRPTNLNEITKASENWGEEFFNPDSFGGDMVGPGHYVSTDLTGARTFGGIDDPQLYVTVIKPNARILDARSEIEEKEAIFKSVQKELNCLKSTEDSGKPAKEVAFSGASIEDWLGFFRNSQAESCRKVIIKAIAALEVDAILYTYNSSNELANCRQDRGEALSIISGTAFDKRQIAYFSNDKAFDPNHVGGLLKRLYDEGLTDYTQLLYLEESMEKGPASLSALKSGIANYENWKSKFVYKCGPKWRNENVKFSFGEWIYQAKDRDILMFKYRINRAYGKRFRDSGNFSPHLDFQQMRGYLEMVARVAGVPLEVWTAAIKKQYEEYSGDPETQINATKEIANILGERPPPDSTLRMGLKKRYEKMFAFLKPLTVKPQLTFAGFRKLGFGPRLTLLQLNVILMAVNGVPFVIGELPLARGGDYSSLMKMNKATYKSYLQGCLSQYQDETLSTEQINAGPCGMIENNQEAAP